MADPIPVTTPKSGDVNYVDHVQLALSRLPEQFKRKQIP